MRYSHVLGAAVVGLAAATVAEAGLSVSLVRTPISAAARAADPTGLQLGRSRTFDLLVTADGADKWASGDLQVSLSANGSGALYSPVGGSDIEQTAVADNILFDTYVTTAAKVNAPSLLGKAQYPVESGTGTYSMTTTALDVAWGDLSAAANAQSSGRVARMTISGMKGMTVGGRVGATNNTVAPQTFAITVPVFGDIDGNGSANNQDINPFIALLLGGTPTQAQIWAGDFDDNGVINNQDINGFVGALVSPGPLPSALGSVVPEPTSLSLAALGCVALVRRVRR